MTKRLQLCQRVGGVFLIFAFPICTTDAKQPFRTAQWDTGCTYRWGVGAVSSCWSPGTALGTAPWLLSSLAARRCPGQQAMESGAPAGNQPQPRDMHC